MEVRNRVYVSSVKSKFEVSLGSLKCEVRTLKWEVGKSGSREVGSRKSEVPPRLSWATPLKRQVATKTVRDAILYEDGSLLLEAGDRLLMSQWYSVRHAKRVYCSLVQ